MSSYGLNKGLPRAAINRGDDADIQTLFRNLRYHGAVVADPAAARDGDLWLRSDLAPAELRARVAGAVVTVSAAGAGTGTVGWGNVTGTPTTVAGYGITDAASSAALAAHEADTTSIHGIADTAALVRTDQAAANLRTAERNAARASGTTNRGATEVQERSGFGGPPGALISTLPPRSADGLRTYIDPATDRIATSLLGPSGTTMTNVESGANRATAGLTSTGVVTKGVPRVHALFEVPALSTSDGRLLPTVQMSGSTAYPLDTADSVDALVDGVTVRVKAERGDVAKSKLDTEIGSATLESTAGAQGKASAAETSAKRFGARATGAGGRAGTEMQERSGFGGPPGALISTLPPRSADGLRVYLDPATDRLGSALLGPSGTTMTNVEDGANRATTGLTSMGAVTQAVPVELAAANLPGIHPTSGRVDTTRTTHQGNYPLDAGDDFSLLSGRTATLLTYGSGVSVESLKPAEAGATLGAVAGTNLKTGTGSVLTEAAIVTSQGTSADTSAVSGQSATLVRTGADRAAGTLDAPGVLKPTTVIQSQNVARGLKRGAAADGAHVTFGAPAFPTTPHVVFSPGGLSYHPDFSAVAHGPVVEALALDAAGFNVRAVLRQAVGSVTPATASFSGDTATKSDATEAWDDRYTYEFSVTVNAGVLQTNDPTAPRSPSSVTLYFYTDDDGAGANAPVLRATRTYSNDTDNPVTYADTVTVAVDLLGAGSTFRIYLASTERNGGSVSPTQVSWGTATAPAERSMGSVPVPFTALMGT